MKSLNELQAIKDKKLAEINDPNAVRVTVGLATCGIAAGAKPVFEAFSDFVKENGLDNIYVKQVGCIGLCQFEPLVEIVKGGETVTYINMDESKAKTVAEKHLKDGEVVNEFTVGSSALK
jgi:NADP-reducing hydrogenase subunit HndB